MVQISVVDHEGNKAEEERKKVKVDEMASSMYIQMTSFDPDEKLLVARMIFDKAKIEVVGHSPVENDENFVIEENLYTEEYPDRYAF